MFTAGNPFHVSGPIPDGSKFIGRRDISAWIWRILGQNERIAVVVGRPLIGKSSLLLDLGRRAAAHYLPVYIDLGAVPGTPSGASATILVDRVQQALLANIAAPADSIVATIPPSAWRALRDLSPAKRPLLLLDNLDQLLSAGDEAGWAFIDQLAELMAGHEDVQIVCTVRALDALRRVDRVPFFRAPWQSLEPLSREEVFRLVKTAAEGWFEFDYEAIARIDELTGRQPYYVQLLCAQIFEQQADSGHAGVIDIEPAMQALGETLIPPFHEAWNQTPPEGKLILSVLGSLKGTREIVTLAEISAGLRGYGIEAQTTEITQVVSELVSRGVLQQLGALSYRASVELFRHWLRLQHPTRIVFSTYRWQPQRRRPARPAPDDEGAGETPKTHTKAWTLTLLIPVVTAIIALIFVLTPWQTQAPPTSTPTATPELATLAAILAPPSSTPGMVLTVDSGTMTRPPVRAVWSLTATVTPTPAPSATPTSAEPALLTRSMPVISFMRKEGNDAWQIWVMSADGSSQIQVTDGENDGTSPVWAPEGLRMAFVSERDGNKEIYVMGADGSNPVNLTQHEADDWTPAWSPDGTEIAFSSMRDGNWEIYVMWADGSYPLRLTDYPESDISPTWSPDGRRIAFASKRDNEWDIYVMDREEKRPQPLTTARGSDVSPAWSPDGRYIAFESTREGNAEIYRMRADGSEQTNLTQTKGANDHWPTWSPDGSKLAFYSNRDGNWDIYSMGVDGSDVVNLTNDERNNQGPAWRP